MMKLIAWVEHHPWWTMLGVGTMAVIPTLFLLMKPHFLSKQPKSEQGVVTSGSTPQTTEQMVKERS